MTFCKNKFLPKIFILPLFFLNLTAAAAPVKDTLRVLFVGNSYIYYNNLIQMISLLSDSMDTKLICTKSTVGGANLSEHWNGLRGLASKQLIEKNHYDIVVIQDNSMWRIDHADSLQFYGDKFCQLIKMRGAKPFLYNTWSRKKTPQTQPLIDRVYSDLAKRCGATVVPVGKCFQKLIQLKPEWELYHPDGSHPSNLGTFFAALAFTKAFTGQIPSHIQEEFIYFDKDGETFRIMRVTKDEINAARDVVAEF